MQFAEPPRKRRRTAGASILDFVCRLLPIGCLHTVLCDPFIQKRLHLRIAHHARVLIPDLASLTKVRPGSKRRNHRVVVRRCNPDLGKAPTVAEVECAAIIKRTFVLRRTGIARTVNRLNRRHTSPIIVMTVTLRTHRNPSRAAGWARGLDEAHPQPALPCWFFAIIGIKVGVRLRTPRCVQEHPAAFVVLANLLIECHGLRP